MDELEKILKLLPADEADKLLKWFKEKAFKKKKELRNPRVNYIPNLARRDVVWIDFGENVGQEICGTHPGVVIYSNSGSGTVLVVPLTTTEAEHELGIDLGNISGMEAGFSYAKVDQIRAISRLRVARKKQVIGERTTYYNNYNKTTNTYNNPKATPEQMDLIDQKIAQFFLKPTKQEVINSINSKGIEQH